MPRPAFKSRSIQLAAAARAPSATAGVPRFASSAVTLAASCAPPRPPTTPFAAGAVEYISTAGGTSMCSAGPGATNGPEVPGLAQLTHMKNAKTLHQRCTNIGGNVAADVVAVRGEFAPGTLT